MARDRDSAQDREIAKMEKLNRIHKDYKKEPTLKEQLEEEKKLMAMTPDQRRAAMDWHDWEYELRNMILMSRKYNVPQRHYNVILMKHRSEMEKFHRDGTAFNIVISWMEEKSGELLNW